MKIAIDARMYGLEHAGIGRYIANLIRETKNQKPKTKNIEIALLVRKKNLEEIKNEVGNAFKIVLCDVPHYSLKEQIIVPLQLIKVRPDLVHFPHFNVPILWWGKQVVTIHDLIKHETKGSQTTTRRRPLYWAKYLAYRFLVWLAVKRAAKIIVPSQWWKKELVRRYKLPPNKIVVTYEGVEENFQFRVSSSQLKGVLSKYGIQKPFVIYTGNLYPHKNVEHLVQAIACLNDSNHFNRPIKLVVICARNVFYQRFKKKIRQMGAEKFVNLVGFVPDEELVEIYQQAEAFVFPSLMEGFGLPGLEAMAAGCPVLASNIPVLREVYGQAALYFNPYDPKDIAKKIKLILEDNKLKQKLKKLGPELAEGYSWQKMAKQTLKVYEDCLHLR